MKTKALISFVVTMKLVCTFVFAYAYCWLSHSNEKVHVGNDQENAQSEILPPKGEVGKTKLTIRYLENIS